MNKLAGFLGVLAMVAVAPSARADFQILVNGVACTPNLSQTNPIGSLTCPSVAGLPAGVTITDLAVTGNQVPGVFSQELGTTLLVTNSTGSAVTLTIDIADSFFSMPTTPPVITDHSGATLNVTTGTDSISLTSCVNQANSLNPTAAPPFCPSPAPGMAAANPTLTQTGAGTASNETAGTISSLTAPFSLMQHIVLSAGAGADFNVTTSQVLSSVPEPTSVLLLGGVLLGVTGLLRKRVAGR
jgi:hypothetical protein